VRLCQLGFNYSKIDRSASALCNLGTSGWAEIVINLINQLSLKKRFDAVWIAIYGCIADAKNLELAHLNVILA
jgi:hypothetical protein